MANDITVAICLAHKNENEFLSEWMIHHFNLGFDFICIYDNDSIDVPESMSRVEVVKWPGDYKGRQSRAYDNFVKRYKGIVDWCLFIDTDEYLELVCHDNVKDFLREYQDESCIYLHRLTYGSSNKDRITSHKKELKKHAPLNFHENHLGKSLLKLSAVDRKIKCVHNLLPKLSVNVLKEEERKVVSKKTIFDVAYIKHYFTRGKKQLEEKFNRGPGENTKDKISQKYKKKIKYLDENVLNLYEEGELLPDRKNIKSIGFPSQKPDYKVWLHGWMEQDNIDCFEKLLGKETKCIVEIGAWMGLSTLHLAKKCPQAKIYSIDTWDMILNENEIFRNKVNNTKVGKEIPNSFDRWCVNCWDYKERITPIRSHSIEGLKYLNSIAIQPDIVYIDACHGYECVVDDIMTVNKLFPNALIIGDDWQIEAVRKAAQDCSKKIGKKIVRVGKKPWYYE